MTLERTPAVWRGKPCQYFDQRWDKSFFKAGTVVECDIPTVIFDMMTVFQ